MEAHLGPGAHDEGRRWREGRRVADVVNMSVAGRAVGQACSGGGQVCYAPPDDSADALQVNAVLEESLRDVRAVLHLHSGREAILPCLGGGRDVFANAKVVDDLLSCRMLSLR